MHNPGSAGRQSLAHRDVEAYFPAEDGGNVSRDLVVQEAATVIRCFGLGDSDRVLVEMVDDEACETPRTAPFAPVCGPVVLRASQNIGVIGLPGRYRLVLLDESGQPVTAQTAASRYADIRIVAYVASINQDFLASYICAARCSCSTS